MNNEDIKNRIKELRDKVFALWAQEGQWESNNPNSPLYGMDKDPLLSLLITALAYQEYQIEYDIERFRTGMVSELEEQMLPYHLLKATPSVAMICTAKAQGNPARCLVGEDSSFTVLKETFQGRYSLNFRPLFESNIIGATVTSFTQLLDGRCKLTLEVTDDRTVLGGVGFLFRNMEFDELTMHYGDKEVPLISPWEYDRFPMNTDFSFWNLIYNKSLTFGTNEQWFDLWAETGVPYYMADPYTPIILSQGTVELTLDFEGLKSKNIDVNNICINAFPVVNVNKRQFALTPSEPIVKIADDGDFFMNLVGEYDTVEEADKFILRRYGCERFGLSELLKLADTLQKKNSTDFYAYQSIPSLQDGDKMRKLRILLKDIIAAVKKNGTPKTGVYALLKENAKVEVSIPLTALYTDGAKGNEIEIGAPVLYAPSDFDLGQTRLLTRSSGGRDEVTNDDERKMLSHYYALTNDKIVTRSDLKSFCVKELYRYDIGSVNRIEVANDEGTRTLVAFVSEVNPGLDLESIQLRLQRLIDIHSSGLMPVKVLIVKQ